MTDREMLEYAAKAAGYEPEDYVEIGIKKYLVVYNPETGAGGNIFDPCGYDGDAFRLAVKLKLWTQINDRCSWAQQDSEMILSASAASSMVMHSETNNDPYAATRSAIVRAAAEIGKEMK